MGNSLYRFNVNGPKMSIVRELGSAALKATAYSNQLPEGPELLTRRQVAENLYVLFYLRRLFTDPTGNY
jgi:hypothetical protein